MRNFDITEAVEAAGEDGYDAIKEYFGGAEFDLDFEELFNTNKTLWETNKESLLISLKNNGNIYSVKVFRPNDDLLWGYCCTYDKCTYSIVCSIMSALRDFIRMVELTNDLQHDKNKDIKGLG